MHAKHFVVSLGKVAIAAVLFFNSLGCSAQTEQINVPTIPYDAPLNVFILGEWLSLEVKSSESGPIELQYKIVFETESRVKFIVIYSDGNTEGYTFTYNFINQNSIFVDNKRAIGGETWLLENKDGDLVITINADNDTIIVLLERIK